jgi:nucleoside-diphosphate-sugar epimerase
MLKQGSKILITGGAGFIGSHAARSVVAAGGMVRILDDFSTGKRDRLIGMPRLDLIQGDVRNPATVQGAARGADAILHLAALPVGSDPGRAQQVQLGGTLNVLDAVRQIDRRDRPRVVLCSSGNVYGKQTAFVLHEELTPRPGTTDGAIALTVEHYGRIYRELHGVQATCLRLFRTFGPEEEADRSDASVVARFIRAALEGSSPAIFGDGQQTRDLVYVDNVVTALRAALSAEPDVYNIASGEAVQINFLWTMVLELTGKRRRAIDPTYVPAPPWDPQHARPQIARACKALGWAPSVRLREGLSRTVQYHQALLHGDPNAWFSPREELPTPRIVTPPDPPEPEIEVSDDDLVIEEKELDIEWAPVPALPGLNR